MYFTVGFIVITSELFFCMLYPGAMCMYVRVQVRLCALFLWRKVPEHRPAPLCQGEGQLHLAWLEKVAEEAQAHAARLGEAGASRRGLGPILPERRPRTVGQPSRRCIQWLLHGAPPGLLLLHSAHQVECLMQASEQQ